MLKNHTLIFYFQKESLCISEWGLKDRSDEHFISNKLPLSFSFLPAFRKLSMCLFFQSYDFGGGLIHI